MSNERLSAAISGAGFTLQDFSDRVGVDPKTVERWITKDRLPHRKHRMTAAALLSKSDGFLWPATQSDARSRSASQAEFVGFYPSRDSVPITTWTELLTTSQDSIDFLVYAGSFLHDSIPQFTQHLAERANSGVRVRLLLGDPQCEAVALRGREEGMEDLMGARCRLMWRILGPVLSSSPVQARMHDTTLYASIFRFDDQLLVNTQTYGIAASHCPVLQLNRIPGGRLFAHYLESYDRVWQDAEPVQTGRA